MCFSVRSALGVRINWRLIVGVSVRASSATTEGVWAACSVSSTRRAGVTRARAARATLSSKMFATELVGCGLSSGFGIPNPTPSLLIRCQGHLLRVWLFLVGGHVENRITLGHERHRREIQWRQHALKKCLAMLHPILHFSGKPSVLRHHLVLGKLLELKQGLALAGTLRKGDGLRHHRLKGPARETLGHHRL